MERASHLEHGCPLTLWNAPNVQAGHIYSPAFCWQAQLHFHRSCLIHLNSNNSKESKENIKVFKYNETSLSILFQQVLTNKSFPWKKFFNMKFNMCELKKGNSWTWKETAEHFPKMNVMWLNIIQFECFLEHILYFFICDKMSSVFLKHLVHSFWGRLIQKCYSNTTYYYLHFTICIVAIYYYTIHY